MRILSPQGLAAALLAPLCTALYEDEVGQYEWIQQQVGLPVALEQAAEATNSKRAFVATTSGVVASVSLKDGTLHWRRIVSQRGGVKLLRTGSHGLLTATDHGLAQAWKSSSGDLVWQQDSDDPVVDLFFLGTGSKQDVTVVREAEAEVRTATGMHVWTATAATAAGASGDGAAAPRFRAATKLKSDGALCAVVGSPSLGARAAKIDVSSRKVVKRFDLPSEVLAAIDAGSSLVVGGSLVTITGDKLSSHKLCDEGASGQHALSKVSTKGNQGWRFVPGPSVRDAFAVTNGVATGIFTIGSKGPKLVKTLESVAALGPVHSGDLAKAEKVAVMVMKNDGAEVHLMDVSGGHMTELSRTQDYGAKDHGSARRVLVCEPSASDGPLAVLVAADHSIAAVRGSKVLWTREEALASIHQATFTRRHGQISKGSVSGPRPDSLETWLPVLAAQASALPGIILETVLEGANSLQNSVIAIAEKFGIVPPAPRPRVKKSPVGKIPTKAFELSRFGSDKLILVSTGASKLFAIEATTSEIVWQMYFPAAELVEVACGAQNKTSSEGRAVRLHGEIGQCGLWMQLLPSSSAAYSELLVIAPVAADGKHGSTTSQELLWLEPLTGKVLHREARPAGASIVSIMGLPRRPGGKDVVMPFLLIDGKRDVHLMPSNAPEGMQNLEENSGRLFHYEVDQNTQVVQGFGISRKDGSQRLQQLWNLELASVGEKIVAAATPEHREWDNVPVHIKADASILYKFINPNLLVLVTQDTVAKDNSNNKGSLALNLYAVDAVTGHMLHQTRVVGASTPVHVVSCDNWVVMHYWSVKRIRFELAVVEFFEAKADDGPWNIVFGKHAANQSKSAHHLESPVPLQQTYIFPAGVTALGVTSTLKGITPRSIIMALTTDHIFRVSKDVLNPRRPFGPASGKGVQEKPDIPAQFASSKDEGLPPYMPLIRHTHTDVLTHQHSVGKVTGFISSPTNLESTSLLFSYGLDLFFAPVQTAKAYDVLSPGFNYKLLYASVTLVISMVIFTSYWAKSKTLQDRWK